MAVIAVQTRGGFPVVRVVTATTTPGLFQMRALTNYLEVRNEGANELRIYTVEADSIAVNSNYIPILAGELWLGPAGLERCWLASSAATTTARVIAFCTK